MFVHNFERTSPECFENIIKDQITLREHSTTFLRTFPVRWVFTLRFKCLSLSVLFSVDGGSLCFIQELVSAEMLEFILRSQSLD